METNQQQHGFDLERYMPRERFERIKAFVADKDTPCLVIDLHRIAAKYDELHQSLPYAKIYYAIKANPHDEVLRLLIDRGCCFDFASIYEMDQALRLGATPDRLSYGNTIKKERDIAYAFSKGVRLFATDSDHDLQKLARQAPGSRVFFRILTDGSGADWPLSRKFGAHPDAVYRLILQAADLGLQPYGISFHVGSQQRDIGQWDHAIAHCRYLFDAVREKGISLSMINLGGGFPAEYVAPTQSTATYAQEITRFLREDFGDNFPEILVEPGRFIAGDAGVLFTEVVLISRKSGVSPNRWIYFDVGKFNGLIETMDESIRYPIYSEKSGPTEEAILAGPTCDSMDILYEHGKYALPLALTEGDRVSILTTGAYAQSYFAVNFNGFPPLQMHILNEP